MSSGNQKVDDKILTLEKVGPIQMGFWIPKNLWATPDYLVPLRNYVNEKKKANNLTKMNTEVAEFKEWINSNSVYRMWFNLMIDQANSFVSRLKEADKKNISNDGDILWIESFDSFFEILNEIINTSPSFNKTAQVGTPINGLLAVSMGTEAGTALFHDATFNNELKKVLNAWNKFLKSEKSLDKLDIHDPEKTGSWISADAKQAGVWTDMEYDPTKEGYGFDSWNSFFIRQFKHGARPFHGPSEVVINIGCETTPWYYCDNLSYESKFWVKDYTYSLKDLFGNHEWNKLFIGGQLYQGYLSATHYHRWKSPIDGRIVQSWLQPGTYFAIRPNQGETPGTWEGTESQPYLGHVATRAIFIFEHKNTNIGYVALLCIGMVEVSTCYIEPKYLVGKNQEPVSITRDTEIGRFEFGGSTHIMIFQKDKVILENWAKDAQKNQGLPNPIPMGSIIAYSHL